MLKPDFLLKYLSQPFFLKNGLFRFTQPAALNDPHEALPGFSFGKYAPEDIAAAREKAGENGILDISDEDLEALFLAPFPAHRYDERIAPGLWPFQEKRLRDNPFNTVAELDHCLGERAIELCTELANRNFGIFSLTTSTDEPMWAYYADNHKGVCVKFHARHPALVDFASPIEYTDTPISISVNEGWIRIAGEPVRTEDILERRISTIPRALLLRKRSSWAHEKEWRMLAHLQHAATIVPDTSSGYDVHLFKFPSDAIQSITFGYNAPEQMVTEALCEISGSSIWKELKVFRRKRTGTVLTEIEIS